MTSLVVADNIDKIREMIHTGELSIRARDEDGEGLLEILWDLQT